VGFQNHELKSFMLHVQKEEPPDILVIIHTLAMWPIVLLLCFQSNAKHTGMSQVH
jgi:hypothetical protein